jgi:cytosine/adenosine deaminase-related metal-dependent hydrolase
MQDLLLDHAVLADGSHADVLVSNGRIAAVGAPGSVDAGDAERWRCTERLVVPGGVNGHFHSSENFHKGRYDRLPLEPWMVFSYPAVLAPVQTPDEIELRTLLGAVELLRGGTTCIVDFLYELTGMTQDTLDAVVRGYRRAGLRALIAIGMGDLPWRETIEWDQSTLPAAAATALDADRPPTWDEWEAFTREAVARHHRPDEGIAIALGPSGPQRCSDEMLSGCAALAQELGLLVHTHVLETRMQAATARRRWGTTMPQALDALGVLAAPTCFEHAIWVDETDHGMIAERGVRVIHNPMSNFKLGSGVCSVRALRTAGVTVGLGTDGPSSNDGSNLLATVKLAALLHRGPHVDPDDWLGAAEAFELATTGGAAATPWQGQLGRIEAGQAADLLLLDLTHHAFTPRNDPLQQLVYGAPSGAISDVLVAGRPVMRDGALVGFDEAAVLAEARAVGADVLGRFADAEAIAARMLDAVMAGWRAVARE